MLKRDELLRQIEQDCRRLDPELRRAALDEIAAHLDASIQARKELGSTFEEAEREAISEFGPVKRVSRALNSVHEPPNVPRGHLLSMTVMTLFLAINLFLQMNRIGEEMTRFVLMGWCMTFSVVLVFFTAASSVRLPWRSILLIAPVALLWFTIAPASAYAPDGPDNFAQGTPYRDAAGLAAQQRAEAASLEAKYRAAQEIYARFQSGENICPDSRGDEGWFKTLRTRHVDDRALAERAWRMRPVSGFLSGASYARAEAARLERVDRRFWWMSIPANVPAAAWLMTLPWLGMLSLFTLCGWCVGAAFRAIRSRIRGLRQ